MSILCRYKNGSATGNPIGPYTVDGQVGRDGESRSYMTIASDDIMVAFEGLKLQSNGLYQVVYKQILHQLSLVNRRSIVLQCTPETERYAEAGDDLAEAQLVDLVADFDHSKLGKVGEFVAVENPEDDGESAQVPHYVAYFRFHL